MALFWNPGPMFEPISRVGVQAGMAGMNQVRSMVLMVHLLRRQVEGPTAAHISLLQLSAKYGN
jgi:hypothetical protein